MPLTTESVIRPANSSVTTAGTRVTLPLRLVPSSNRRRVTSNSSPSIVEATRDGDKYIVIDLTECKNARAIREHIISQFPIPSNLHSDFAIYLTEIGGITIGNALDDDNLLLYRQFAEMASTTSRPRFIIQRMGTPSDTPLGEGSMTMSSPWNETPATGRMTPNLPILEDSDSDNTEALTRFTQGVFSQIPNKRRDSLINRHRRTLSESHARSKPKCITVMVTQDQDSYLPIDISHLTDAQSIRKGILSGLRIPESDQSNFAIFYSKSNEFSNCTPLDDNQLFVRCRRSGDETGSVRLLALRISAPFNKQSSANRRRSYSSTIEPLRVSVPLVYPRPSLHSPSASGPSPRTESAPPLVNQSALVDRLPAPNQDGINNSQAISRRVQLHDSSQTLCPAVGRSRASSLVNMPNRRTSDISASPATLLALKFKSGYAASNLSVAAPRSAPDVSCASNFQSLKGTSTSRGMRIPLDASISEPVYEDRRAQVKKLLDNLVEQPLRPLGPFIHSAESSRETQHPGEEGFIEYQNRTEVGDGLPASSSAGLSTASGTLRSASNDPRQRATVYKDIELRPTNSLVIINGEMPVAEILQYLHDHGCSNVTSQLGNYEISQIPVATGGFGDIYIGKLPGDRQIGLKCIRLLIDPTDNGRKNLKRAARELYIWSKCQHSSILALIGVTEHRGQIAMVSPWMKNGNLSRFLSREPRPQVNVCLLNQCAQIADGVAYLHQNKIVHGDLKGANVLISDDFTPKIIDFGGAGLKKYTLRFATTTSRPGLSVRWTAPEVINEETENSVEADVYSLAMTILEAISGTHPYASVRNEGAVIRRIILGIHPDRPEAYISSASAQGSALWDLLARCWEYSPVNRPTAGEVRDIIQTITPDGLR